MYIIKSDINTYFTQKMKPMNHVFMTKAADEAEEFESLEVAKKVLSAVHVLMSISAKIYKKVVTTTEEKVERIEYDIVKKETITYELVKD